MEVRKLVLPCKSIDKDIDKYDLIGITLYEDLFTEIKEYLILLQKQFQGVIAAGGPMVTLNPLSSFKKFALFAHSPFLIPYSTTPLYSILIKDPAYQNQIKYKTILKSKRKIFEFPLVNRLETRFPNLNRLLKNEKIVENNGFFDYLKQRKYLQALKTVYSFLREERILFESLPSPKKSNNLKKIESKLETYLSRLI